MGVEGPILENQMERKIEHEMETGLYRGYMRPRKTMLLIVRTPKWYS